MSDNRLMQNQEICVENIYIPAARRKLLDSDKADNIAMSIIEHGQKTHIQVLVDGQRYVLVEGLHRLEACKLLGEEKNFSNFCECQTPIKSPIRRYKPQTSNAI